MTADYGGGPRQYWTRPNLPGKKLADQPAFVLTSSRMFSGAEEFGYNLKSLKRATIVEQGCGDLRRRIGRRLSRRRVRAIKRIASTRTCHHTDRPRVITTRCSVATGWVPRPTDAAVARADRQTVGVEAGRNLDRG